MLTASLNGAPSPLRHPNAMMKGVRLIKEKRGALFEDIRNLTLLFIVLICLLVLGGLCVKLVFFDKDATAETQKWAETALTALASGGAAFLFGRALPSKK
jgi:hypothetical protein